ncbi:BnaC04g02850D [Brassica napus]|nr:BnaC04g02850D [Brassica napus]
MSNEDEEMSRTALSAIRAKEEEIEKNKMEIRERVQAQLGRVEEETKRLALIREELEGLAEPMRKEVALARKKIDSVNKELKPLGHTVQKKEREYKEALEAFNEKNREKVQLITKLTEVSQLILKSFSFFYLLNIVIGDSEEKAHARQKAE